MSETTVAVLTPPGSGAVAVLEVRGPRAWPVILTLFRTATGNRLTEMPTSFAFGRIGGASADEVILLPAGPDAVEVQCHGGPTIVRWLLDLFRANGVADDSDSHPSTAATAAKLLTRARTTRTAAILLDQLHGAYDRATASIDAGTTDAESIKVTLRRNARAGRHLVQPWTVAIAGHPNAGKSSLLNALVGFTRSVVSPVPGTTRDALAVSVAFDGWPVDLIDTAGVREAPDGLEAEGIDRARAAVTDSDLVLWVVDATGPRPNNVPEVAGSIGLNADRVVVVFNKTDVIDVPAGKLAEALRVSARTGAGLNELVTRVVAALVPEAPAPGDPVPFTPELCDRWSPP